MKDDPKVNLVSGILACVAAGIPVIQRLIVLPVYRSGDASSGALAQFNRLSSILLLPGKLLVTQIWAPTGHHFSTPQLLLAALLNLILYFVVIALLWRCLSRSISFGGTTASGKLQTEPNQDVSSETPVSPERREFLAKAAVGTLGLTVFTTGAYPVLIEPGWLSVRRVTVPLKGLPPSLSGLTIAHLTDFHHDEWISLHHIRDAVRLANELKPDIMALTGDYVTIDPKLIKPAVMELANLKPQIGSVAVLGNHDWWSDVAETRKRFAEIDIPVLDNSRRFLTADRKLVSKSDAGLCIGGVGDLWEDDVSPEEAFHNIPDAMPRVLLSHNPDVAEDHRIADQITRVDLMLSGHTHGGQVRLPGVGTPIVPSGYGSKYAQGLVQGPGCPIQISAGIGLALLPVRLNVRPEIVLVTLQCV